MNQKLHAEISRNSSSLMDYTSLNLIPDHQTTQFNPSLCYGAMSGQSFREFLQPISTQSVPSYRSEPEVKKPVLSEPSSMVSDPVANWDPKAMLSSLSFLEQKIHQLQGMVRSIVSQEGQFPVVTNELAAQQQLVTADLTCIIIELISTAGTLLPSIKKTILSTNSSAGQSGGNITASPSSLSAKDAIPPRNEGFTSEGSKVSELGVMKGPNDFGSEGTEAFTMEEHDAKDDEDGADGENLPPGSYEVLQLEKEEILAPHTHFCMICGKGFKRDANLRMHMRGHGDEYKTAAALAKPSKELNSEPVLIKRYSCPFMGCKRNKEHKKFQPLKTILCVKNHYKRSHCDKSYTCSRCKTKKFSVIADLKTHEKHCGRDKWLCSCGTTFSRKDKLFGHVALFQGHTPVLLTDEIKSSGGTDEGKMKEAVFSTGNIGYNFGEDSVDDVNVLDIKGIDDDGYYLPMNFDSCNFGGLDDFPRPAFGVTENSNSPSFLPSGSCNLVRKHSGYLG